MGANGAVRFLNLRNVVCALAVLIGLSSSAFATSTPTIVSISPNSGPEAISPYPTIKGTNFQSGAKVYVNGIIARGAWFGSAAYVTFQPPLSAVLGAVDVKIVNPDGGTATLTKGWSFTTASLLVNGACGSSNGASLTAAPTANLCTAGTTSAVAGSGPWSWSCTGLNGGTKASCTASLKASTPTITSISPNSGADTVSPYPTLKGTNFQTGAQVYVNGTVARGVWPGTGTAASTVLVFQPPLSAVTGAVAVKVVNPDGGNATLANGFTYTSASLAAKVNGACGAANGTTVSTAPASGLCTTGTASALTGTGPWSWGCAGSNGGTNASCSAALLKPTVPLPTITSISPNSGPDTISPFPTMKGTNFEAGVQVYVNGVAALGVWPGTGTSASTVLVFQPPLSAVTGTVDVKVVNPDGGAVTLAGGFDYTSASLGGGSGGGSAPPPTTNGDTFPRLAYLAIGGTQSYNADYQKRAAKFHIAILGGNWEGWENNRGYTMDQVVKNVKAQSKVHTRVFEYVDLNEKANPQKINPNTGTNFKASDSEFSGYWTEVNNMRWWVFNGWNASNGCTGGSNGYGGCVITQDGEDSGGTMAVINMTSSAATDGGLNAYAWGANYVNNLLHAGKMMRAPDPDLDGFFLDNLAPHPYENGDWLHKGSSQSETDTIVDLAFRTGEKAYFDEMSKIWPTGVQFANMGLDSVATDNGVDFTPLKGVMSGGLDEAAIGATWSYEYWSGAARMQNVYRYTWDNIGGPKYIIFGHSHLAANGSDATGNGSGGSITSPAYQGMRYGIAACLMGDGYYAPTLPSGYVSDASVWFDEFDNSGAGEGYLGLPTQSWQTVAWSKGVWKREYQNGIVLWNPKGNGAQTVSLAGLGNLKHLKGTQVPSINNGAVVTNGSVTLQDRDGLILLRY